MSKPRDDRQKDLLLPALDQIIDMSHPLVRLAALIDWKVLDGRFSSVCQAGSGQPGLPTRLVAGPFILKHMHNLSDEVLCARWIAKPPANAVLHLPAWLVVQLYRFLRTYSSSRYAWRAAIRRIAVRNGAKGPA